MGHLVLIRHEGQGVLIGENVVVRVLRKRLIEGQVHVQLSLMAPDDVKITRLELLKDPPTLLQPRVVAPGELAPRRRRRRIA